MEADFNARVQGMLDEAYTAGEGGKCAKGYNVFSGNDDLGHFFKSSQIY